MKKNVVKFLSALVLSVVVSAPVFADDAVVTFVKGKVEVQRGTSWVALAVGDKVTQSDTISTGIQSEAKIKYNGSLMALGAMTRVTLDQLSSGNNREKVEVNLQTGAVRSKVTHTEDTRVSYKVRSPVAVASVRGTEFEITEAGKVSCFEGAVAVAPAKKQNAAPSDSAEVEEKKEEEKSEEAASEGAAETPVGDNGPAEPTTPANEIDPDASDSSVVVGAKQKTEIKKDGTAEKPQDNAQKNATKVKAAGATAAAKEAVTTGGASSGATAGSAPAPKTGSIQVTISFEE